MSYLLFIRSYIFIYLYIYSCKFKLESENIRGLWSEPTPVYSEDEMYFLKGIYWQQYLGFVSVCIWMHIPIYYAFYCVICSYNGCLFTDKLLFFNFYLVLNDYIDYMYTSLFVLQTTSPVYYYNRVNTQSWNVNMYCIVMHNRVQMSSILEWNNFILIFNH